MRNIIKVAAFLGSFLLFQLELLTGFQVLPSFGGSFYVWPTCVFFFTLVLLLAYIFIDYINKCHGLKKYLIFHTIIFIISSFFLVPDFSTTTVFSGTHLGEIFTILVLLTKQIGLPFFLLSCNLSLIQIIQNQIVNNGNAYRLFAISNVGSLAGLILSPLFFALFELKTQWSIWNILFILVIILYVMISITITRQKIKEGKKEGFLNYIRITKNLNIPVILISFLSCSFMLSVTNFVTIGIGSLPVLWMIPLAIYLLSFALVFRGGQDSKSKMMRNLTFLWLLLFVLGSYSQVVSILAHYLFLFLVCMILHRSIFLLKPKRKKSVTAYNISISFGGFLGTCFIILFIPTVGRNISNVYLEFLLSCFCLFIFFIIRDRKKICSWSKESIGAVLILAIISIIIFEHLSSVSRSEIYYSRNFFGINRVINENGEMAYINGVTVHGKEKIEEIRKKPQLYYHLESPLSDIFKASNTKKNVAIVGLGVGSMAYYAKAGEDWDFYDIDKDIIKIANTFFSFLKQSKGNINILLGDGRHQIKKANKKYDLIVIDAFSNNAIPHHLITQDALQVYLEKLSNDGQGVLFHISNNYINLESVLTPLAVSLQLKYLSKTRVSPAGTEFSSSKYYMITKNDYFYNVLKDKYGWEIPKVQNSKVWTDNYVNVLIPLFY